ncbi:MAG: hypothetical protein V4508_19240 [Pseudomonadota bacterium]
MFGSTVLEVAIGLTFCYATLALIVSAMQEAISALLRLRAHGLLEGIKTMLNDPHFSAMARDLYAHALVNPHDDGTATDPRALKAKPSYIEPRHFAQALLDNLQTIPGNYAQLGRDIEALGDPQVRRVLAGIYQRAAGDMEQFQDALAGWFDSAMERVSGAYRRRAKLFSLLLTLSLAVLLNVDSVHLFSALWQHPSLTAQLGASGSAPDPQTLAALWRLPIGWSAWPAGIDRHLALQAAGWLLTAATGLFGAPFWFDLLQHAVHMRDTGDKPKP